jgi:hypothetical protein
LKDVAMGAEQKPMSRWLDIYPRFISTDIGNYRFIWYDWLTLSKGDALALKVMRSPTE